MNNWPHCNIRLDTDRCNSHCNLVVLHQIARNCCIHTRYTIARNYCLQLRNRLMQDMYLVKEFSVLFASDTETRTTNRTMVYIAACCCSNCSSLVYVQMNLSFVNFPSQWLDSNRIMLSLNVTNSLNYRRALRPMLDFDFPI